MIHGPYVTTYSISQGTTSHVRPPSLSISCYYLTPFHDIISNPMWGNLVDRDPLPRQLSSEESPVIKFDFKTFPLQPDHFPSPHLVYQFSLPLIPRSLHSLSDPVNPPEVY